MNGQAELLDVSNLSKRYRRKNGYFSRNERSIVAVDDISFSLAKGETLSLVGESGCGKSTLGQLIVRLVAADSGHVRLSGKDLVSLPEKEMRSLRDQIQIVFQDPLSTFNPRMTIAQALTDALLREHAQGRQHIERRIAHLLQDVGLETGFAGRYPHELSGGQCQRVAIARALASNPDILICDESVSALDVSIQAQIINLLQDIQEIRGVAILFISHDLAVVRHISSRVAVMYLGRFVELASRDALFQDPLHPYTKMLMAAAMNIGGGQNESGEVGDPARRPTGCAFHPRCGLATTKCRSEAPEWRQVKPGRQVACHHV